MEFDETQQPIDASRVPLDSVPPGNTTHTPHKKKQTLFIFGIVILLITILGISSYSYLLAIRKLPVFSSSQQPKKIVAILPTETVAPTQTRAVVTTPEMNIPYTDATLGATFQYPSTLTIVHNDWMPGTKIGDSFGVTLQDKNVIHYSDNKLYVYSNDGIYLGFEDNSQNYTLAQYYQHNFPGGMQRYANVSFETVTNPNGIQFQRLILPYKDNDYTYSLEVMHNGKYYAITRTFTPPTSQSQDLYQRENAAFTQIINSFKFTN